MLAIIFVFIARESVKTVNRSVYLSSRRNTNSRNVCNRPNCHTRQQQQQL